MNNYILVLLDIREKAINTEVLEWRCPMRYGQEEILVLLVLLSMFFVVNPCHCFCYHQSRHSGKMLDQLIDTGFGHFVLLALFV